MPPCVNQVVVAPVYILSLVVKTGSTDRSRFWEMEQSLHLQRSDALATIYNDGPLSACVADRSHHYSASNGMEGSPTGDKTYNAFPHLTFLLLFDSSFQLFT